MMEQLTDIDRVKHMIKLAVDGSAKVSMPQDSFLKAMGEEPLGDRAVIGVLQTIQAKLDDKLKNVEWRIILGYDNVNKHVTWHLVSDRSWYFSHWKGVHACSDKCPVNRK
jgi:hypothetical protein